MNNHGVQTRRTDYGALLGDQEFFVTPLLKKSIDEVLGCIGKPPSGAKVLDIGAGECPLRGKLEALGYAYSSLDIEQNATETIDYLARIDCDLPESLALLRGFDLLILTEVLEHVADWSKAFDNLSKMLKLLIIPPTITSKSHLTINYLNHFIKALNPTTNH